MANKRNYEWPSATEWSGYFTQDQLGGVTQKVSVSNVENKLRADGFLDAAHLVASDPHGDRQRANHTGTQTASTISDFAASVRSVVLTGLSLVSSAAITATDTILSALGKLQAQITGHKENTSNPHSVTKAQVGLGNVSNDAQVTRLEMGVANGVATLDGGAKIPLIQLPDSILGHVSYQGVWDASTNTPTLADPGTKGHYYKVSVAGTWNGMVFNIGDWVISNGVQWDKVDNTDAVSSVFGRTGAVTAQSGDYDVAKITGLQTELDAKVAKSGDTMSGNLLMASGLGVLTNTSDGTDNANILFGHTDVNRGSRIVLHGNEHSDIGNIYMDSGNGASLGSIYLRTGAKVVRLSISGVGAINIPGLTASRVVLTDASKNLVSSTTTATQLEYLSTLTGNVQTALDDKVSKSAGAGTTQSVLGGLIFTPTTTAGTAFRIYPQNRSISTLEARGDGSITWGDGTNARDTNLYRSAANTLKTDDSFVVGGTLAVTGAIYTLGHIYTNTSNGDDNDYLNIGHVNNSRGARVRTCGNEFATPGTLYLDAGNVSGGRVVIRTGSYNESIAVADTGAVTMSSTLAVTGAMTTSSAQTKKLTSVATAGGTTTLDATSHIVVFTGTTTQTCTLPAASTGREIIIKNRSTGNVTINRAGSDTIDGGTSLTLTTNQVATLVANGTDWCVL